jgi:hypothetical protein
MMRMPILGRLELRALQALERRLGRRDVVHNRQLEPDAPFVLVACVDGGRLTADRAELQVSRPFRRKSRCRWFRANAMALDPVPFAHRRFHSHRPTVSGRVPRNNA